MNKQMEGDFFALDVETANPDYGSICQIGIVQVSNGQFVKEWSILVDPEDYFDSFNVEIHKISEKDVKGAPTFDQVYPELQKLLENNVVIHHTHFDKYSINKACDDYELSPFEARWLDSAKIVRRTWLEFSKKGYALKNISSHLGFEYRPHDALEDAKMSARVTLAACELSGNSINDWFEVVAFRSSRVAKRESLNIPGNPNGELYGETIVFTGSLFLERREAAQIASQLGCNVKKDVTKATSILVVGIQNVNALKGHSKSSKHRKAEKLIDNGQPIKIIDEQGFVDMCNRIEPDFDLEIPQRIVKCESKPKFIGKGIRISIDSIFLGD